MKTKNIILTLLATLLIGCAEDVERLAQPYLERARLAHANKQYSQAKLQLDSIKMLYPKAFDARRQAQSLLLRVELDESLTGKQYVDSLLQEYSKQIAPLTAKLYLDKDPRYQEVGTYYASRHRTEQNVGRSYMRPQVSEQGEGSIIVFHRGRAIHAHTLRFTAPDGTYVELKAADASYISSDALGRTERADFVVSNDSNVASFVSLHPAGTFKVSLVGQDGTASVPFSKADAEALGQVCQLTTILSSVNELEKQLQELDRRINFINNRLSADSIDSSL